MALSTHMRTIFDFFWAKIFSPISRVCCLNKLKDKAFKKLNKKSKRFVLLYEEEKL